MKREARNHVKLRFVQRDLKLPACYVIGIMESLWLEASQRFPRGDIGRMSNEEIALTIEYPGDGDELIASLVKRRLLDEIPDSEGRLYVHDWHEHCDRHVVDRLVRGRHKTFANGTPVRRRGEKKDESEEVAVIAEDKRVSAPISAHERPKDENGRARAHMGAHERPFSDPRGCAQPEPEPEPEPEPAASGGCRESEAAPPPEDLDRELADAMLACMPPGKRPPSGEQVGFVIRAARGDVAGAVEFLRAEAPRLRQRREPPREYALLWRLVEREFGAFLAARRQRLAAERADRRQAEAAIAAAELQAEREREIEAAVEALMAHREADGRLEEDLARHRLAAAQKWPKLPKATHDEIARTALRNELRGLCDKAANSDGMVA